VYCWMIILLPDVTAMDQAGCDVLTVKVKSLFRKDFNDN